MWGGVWALGVEHERVLDRECERFREGGYRVVRTNGRVPDAILVKEGRVLALEVMGVRKKAKAEYFERRLRERNRAFDDVVIKVFKMRRKPRRTAFSMTEREQEALDREMDRLHGGG